MNEEKFVFSTEIIEKIKKRSSEGYKIPRHEIYWFNGIPLVRKNGLVFKRTTEETLEYMKCKLGIDVENMPYINPETQTLKQSGVQYFAEKYCKIKLDDGGVGDMILRDYQKNILNLFMDNDRAILMASRQVGKCVDMLTIVEYFDEKNKKLKKCAMYKILFKNKQNKTLYDCIKYILYSIINIIN